MEKFSYLGKEVVKSAHEAFVKAVTDLTDLGYDMAIEFGYCKLLIIDKNLSYHYRRDFSEIMNVKSFEMKVLNFFLLFLRFKIFISLLDEKIRH